ncbi:MAG: DUF6452 family protein, partial [Flavobacterium sp.]
DDICDANTPTTPRLVISFFEFSEPTKSRNVKDLMVIGETKTEGIIFNETVIDTTRFVANTNKISIPLRTDALTTTYRFVYNSLSTTPAAINTDVIKFNYIHQNVYVSRACGFKTIFTLDQAKPFEQTDPAGDGLWMQQIFVKTLNVEFEDETHIEVYF